MILSVSNIHKSFNEIPVLRNVSFHIEDYEKAAVVGINGAGKTTLLRIIVGELTPDLGQVVLSKGKTLGYLAQNAGLQSKNSIYDELLSVKRNLTLLEEQIQATELAMKDAGDAALAALMEKYSLLTHQYESGGGYTYKS